MQKFYTGQSVNFLDNIADIDVQCTDMSKFCACDASGCYSDPNLINVQLFSVCESASQFYILLYLLNFF